MKSVKICLSIGALIAGSSVLAGILVSELGTGAITASIHRAAADDSASLHRLHRLGKQGRLLKHADLLGEVLATRLEAEWKAEIASHAELSLATAMRSRTLPKSAEPTGLTPDQRTLEWADLFYSSRPKTNASKATWHRVGQAGIHLHIESSIIYEPGADLPITIVIYSALEGLNTEAHALTFGFMVDEVRVEGVRAFSQLEESYGEPFRFVLASRSGFPSSGRHSMSQPRFVWQDGWIPKSEPRVLSVHVDARIEFLDGDSVVCAWDEPITRTIVALPES